VTAAGLLGRPAPRPHPPPPCLPGAPPRPLAALSPLPVAVTPVCSLGRSACGSGGRRRGGSRPRRRRDTFVRQCSAPRLFLQATSVCPGVRRWGSCTAAAAAGATPAAVAAPPTLFTPPLCSLGRIVCGCGGRPDGCARGRPRRYRRPPPPSLAAPSAVVAPPHACRSCVPHQPVSGASGGAVRPPGTPLLSPACFWRQQAALPDGESDACCSDASRPTAPHPQRRADLPPCPVLHLP